MRQPRRRAVVSLGIPLGCSAMNVSGSAGKRVTGVYITHGHQDHWIGLARLQEHFPGARGIATPEVVERDS